MFEKTIRLSTALIYFLLASLAIPAQSVVLRHTIENPHGILSVKFSPDGKTLACVGEQVFRLFNPMTGELLRTLESDQYFFMETVAFSPDGKFLAGAYGSTLKIIHVKTGKVHKSISVHPHISSSHEHRITSLKFSPDSKRLAMVSGGHESYEGPLYGEIKLWDVKSGKLALELPSENDFIWAVDFSPDGTSLATGGHNQTIKIWDLESKRSVAVLAQNNGAINSLSFTADGKKLLTSGEDLSIKIWNTQNWKLAQELKGHTDRVLAVVAHQGKIISAGSKDQTIRIWEMNTGKILSVIKTDEDWNTVAISPDGKTLAAGSADGTVMVWEIK